MSGIILLEETVAYVRAGFDKKRVAEVREYAGEFSAAEMKGVSYNCPAILITLLGWKPAAEGARMTGRHAKSHRMAAFVVTKHAKSREARMKEAMGLSEDLAVLLRQWAPMAQEPYATRLKALDITIAGLSDEPTCENLYNQTIDAQGQALWLVDWYQDAKGVIPINHVRPVVPLANMSHVEIEDTVRGGQTPDAPPDSAAPLSVTEQIDFAQP